MPPFHGLGMNMGNLSRLSDARSRSISPENFSGEKNSGARATSGTGAEPGETFTLADIHGSGAIQQIWITISGHWRFSIFRAFWDDQEHPSIESPVGDFFASGCGEYAQVSSLPVCVNPGSAFDSYWEMPFRKRARLTFTNIGDETVLVYYQINYTLTEGPEDCADFHAQFRRVNPLPYKELYTVLDGDEHPTICGTGTEDYFCGSYNFESVSPDGRREYRPFTTPYAGLPQVIIPDGLYRSQQRFGMYRWHIPDPIHFEPDVRVTIQALGWRSGGRYLPMQDDIASVAYWYQTLPSTPFAPLPDKDSLEVI